MVNIGSILQVQGVTGIDRAINTIQSKLAGIQTKVNVRVGSDGFNRLSVQAKTVAGNIDSVTKSIYELERASIQSNRSLSDLERTSGALGKSVGLATKRFAAFAIGAGSVIAVVAALKKGVSEAFDFNRELIKLIQVGGDTADVVKDIEKEVSRLSVTLGVSSNELVKAAVTLRQAGFSAKDTKVALEALAKSSLAPNFKDIADTTEGMIAIFSQFKIQAEGLQGALGSINAVAGGFAVEAEDLIKAVKTAGGVFAQSGGQLNELLALFTSVRSTTRESADSIGTAFRTIFARVQRPETIELLRQLGIQLVRTEEDARALGNVDLKGTFVGPYEAVRRLSSALKDLPEGDTRLIQISELIGGYRQISKVLPLIKEFETSQKALNIAITGQSSLTKDAVIAQDAFLVKFTKLKEEFLEFVRTLTESDGFKTFIDFLIKGASAAIKLADALKPLIPLVAAIGSVKLLQGAFPFVRQASSAFFSPTRKHDGGRIPFARGGIVPGTGNTDSVPAALMPGEFVIKKDSAQKIGYDVLSKANHFADGGAVRSYKAHSRGLNKFLRTGYIDPDTDETSQDYKNFAKELTLDLKNREKIKDNLVLHRGISKEELSYINNQLGDSIFANNVIGKIFTDKGFTSTSTDPNVAKKFGKTNLVISAKAGSRAYDISDGSLEKEVLLQRGSKFKITNSDKIKNKIFIQLLNSGGSVGISPEDFAAAVNKADFKPIRNFGKAILRSKSYRDEVLSKIPAGSKFLANGAEAIVFKTPQNEVVRVGRRGKFDPDSPTNIFEDRPNLPEFLQPLESSKVGRRVLVERLPLAEMFPSYDAAIPALNSLTESLVQKRFMLDDLSAKNIGLVNGEPKIIDPNVGYFLKRPEFRRKASGGKILKGLMGSVSSLALLLSGGGPKEVVKFFEEKRRQENAALVKKALVAETGFGSGIIKKKFAKGGSITDSVPALLTPGEFVFNERAARRIGYDKLEKANMEGVAKFATGGVVGRSGRLKLAGGSSDDFPLFPLDIGEVGKLKRFRPSTKSFSAEGLFDVSEDTLKKFNQTVQVLTEDVSNLSSETSSYRKSSRELFNTLDTEGKKSLLGLSEIPSPQNLGPGSRRNTISLSGGDVSQGLQRLGLELPDVNNLTIGQERIRGVNFNSDNLDSLRQKLGLITPEIPSPGNLAEAIKTGRQSSDVLFSSTDQQEKLKRVLRQNAKTPTGVRGADLEEAATVLTIKESNNNLIKKIGRDYADQVKRINLDQTLTSGQRQERISTLKQDFQARRADIIGQGFINTDNSVLNNPLLSKIEKDKIRESLAVVEKFKERLKIEGERNEAANEAKKIEELQLKNEKLAKTQRGLGLANTLGTLGFFGASFAADQFGAGPKTQGALIGGSGGLSAGSSIISALGVANPVIATLAVVATTAAGAIAGFALAAEEESKKIKQNEFNKQLRNTVDALETFANRVGDITFTEVGNKVVATEKGSRDIALSQLEPSGATKLLRSTGSFLSDKIFAGIRFTGINGQNFEKGFNELFVNQSAETVAKTRRDQLQKDFGGQLPLIQAGLQRQLEDTLNKNQQGSFDEVFDEFLNSSNGAARQLIRITAELREIPIFQVQDEFKKTLQGLRSRQQNEAQQIKGAAAVKETSLRFDILAKLLDGVTDRFERLGQVTDQLSSQFNSSFSNARSNITGNINSFGSLNPASFRGGVGALLGGFGGAGNDLRDQALALDDAIRVLPDAIAGAIGQSVSRDGRTPGEAAQAQILKEFQQRGIKLPDFIRESLLANLSKFDEGQFSKEVRTKGADAVARDLLKDASDAVISSLLALSKAFDEGINTLTNGERELQRQFQQVTAETARVAQIQSDNAVRLAEIEGARRFDPGFAVRTTAEVQRSAVLARQAQFGGVVLDPEAQRQRLEDSQRRQIAVRQELTRNDNSPERIALLLRELTTLESEAQRAGNALRALAGETTNTLIAIAKQRLDFIQQQREARLDAKTQLLTASGAERQDIATGATLFKQAANAGNLNNFLPEQIKQILSFAQRFGNVSGAGLGRPNESLNTILKQLIDNTKRTAFGEDLSFLDLGNLISEEQKLIEEIRNLGKIQEDAQKAIASTLGNTNKEFINQLDAQFKTFFAKQDQLIAEQLRGIAAQRQQRAVADQGDFLQKNEKAIKSLENLGLGIGGGFFSKTANASRVQEIQRNAAEVNNLIGIKARSENRQNEIGSAINSLRLDDIGVKDPAELVQRVRSLGIRGINTQTLDQDVLGIANEVRGDKNLFGERANIEFKRRLQERLIARTGTIDNIQQSESLNRLQQSGVSDATLEILRGAKSSDLTNILSVNFNKLADESARLAENVRKANAEFEARRDNAARQALGPLPAVFQNGVDGLFSGIGNSALFAGVTTGLDSAAKTFQAAVAQIPQQIDFNGNHKVEVLINGLDILTQLEPGIQNLITQNVNDAISNLQRNNPGLRS